jgi:hypothetical protein
VPAKHFLTGLITGEAKRKIPHSLVYKEIKKKKRMEKKNESK